MQFIVFQIICSKFVIRKRRLSCQTPSALSLLLSLLALKGPFAATGSTSPRSPRKDRATTANRGGGGGGGGRVFGSPGHMMAAGAATAAAGRCWSHSHTTSRLGVEQRKRLFFAAVDAVCIFVAAPQFARHSPR